VATVVAVNLIVFCLLAEGAALLVQYIRTGRLFYIDRPTYEPIPETAAGRLTADVLNPYFGPSHRTGVPFEVPPDLRAPGEDGPRVATNNFGFASPYSFPIIRARDDQFIIGIFGGSVGVWFCQVGVERLLSDLQQHRFFQARRLIPLCMAHEGYKQPQQLLVLAYFLSIGQPFDLVINIDGFNEVALSALNNEQGLDISMPSVLHLNALINLIDQETLTPEKLASLAAIARHKERLNSLAGTLTRNRSAAIDVVLGLYRRSVLSEYDRERQVFNDLPSARSGQSLIGAIPPTEQRAGPMLFEDIARNWAGASRLMQTKLAARGAAYVHVLQPNQYHTSRSFSAEEARVAIDAGSGFKPGVERGYPALVAEAAAQRLGIVAGFFDGTRIFDDEGAPVYVDSCCHYTRVGNLRLADFLARAILSVPGPWQREATR
jgi:hypothetical protein